MQRYITPQGQKLLNTSNGESLLRYSRPAIPQQLINPTFSQPSPQLSNTFQHKPHQYKDFSTVQHYQIQQRSEESSDSDSQNRSSTSRCCIATSVAILLVLLIAVYVGLKYFHIDQKLHFSSNSSSENTEGENQKIAGKIEETTEKKSSETLYMVPPHHLLKISF